MQLGSFIDRAKLCARVRLSLTRKDPGGRRCSTSSATCLHEEESSTDNTTYILHIPVNEGTMYEGTMYEVNFTKVIIHRSSQLHMKLVCADYGCFC